MNTQKGNKLIAEFMEVPRENLQNLWRNPYGIGYLLTQELKYHKSWDWLMPVVKKLFGILDKEKSSHPKFYDTIKHISVHLIQGHIGEVWLTCVRCIEWYNKQKIWKSPEESPYLYKREERYV